MNDRQKRLVQNLVGVYAFYQRELDEFSIRIWSDACAEFDIGDIEAAFARHLKDPDAGRWCPKPADIVRQIRGDVDEAALIAWGQVLECVRSGRYDRIEGATRQAVQSMGGWSVIGRADESQNGFLQRRFCEAFKVYHRRGSEEAALLAAEVIGRLA